MRTLIKNVTVLTMDEESHVYPGGYVVVENGRISEVGAGSMPGMAAAGDGICGMSGAAANDGVGGMSGMAAGCDGAAQDFDEVVDGRGGILMPGMINAHSHISMIPFRSMGDDCPDRLRRFLFPLELEAMTPELVYRAARYAICELLLSGVTGVADMYYFEDEVARACEEMGIHAWVGETVIDQETCDSKNTDEALKICEALILKWKDHERIHPMVAPHAPNTNSPEALKAAYELAKKYGVPYMLHVSEMDYEMAHFREKYGQTPVEFMNDIGVLGPETLAVHGIHLTENDIQLMAKTGAKLVHCVAANTKSGKGICPVYEARNAGVTVGVGTDGPSSGNTLDMFTQFRMIPLFQKTKYHDRSILTAKEVVRMGTVGSAKVLGAEKEMGSIEVGKRANLVLIETESANMFPVYNPYSAIVYSANASNVDCVWVDGELLVRGHKLVKADLLAEREALEREMTAFRERAERFSDVI